MKQTQNQQRESAELPAQKQGLLLRLTADMFRQHSELYLKHAAVLERVASNPSDPLAWQLEEPSPESIQDKLLQENVAALSVKGYQGMLQVQKRVNFMEGLMMKNGVGKRAIVTSRGKKEKVKGLKEDPCSPFYWFIREHSVRVGVSVNQPAWSPQVRREVQKLWQRMNPAERKPYVDKAERAKQTSTVTAAKKSTSSSLKSDTNSGNPESKEDSESDSSFSSEEEERKLLFQSRARSSEIELSSAKAEESSESEDETY